MFKGYENIERVRLYKTCSKCKCSFKVPIDKTTLTFDCVKHRTWKGKCIDCGLYKPYHLSCNHKKYNFFDWIKSFFCT